MEKDPSLAVVILAAGKGKRMKSKLPKVLFEICGKPALFYPIEAAASLAPKKLVTVVGFGADQIQAAFQESFLDFVLQKELLGTGHALQMTAKSLKDFKGDLLVLYGDGPLIKSQTLKSILSLHRAEQNMATIMTAVHKDPTGYGRIVRQEGRFIKIVEEKDADEETKKICEVNTGITVYKCPQVFKYLSLLKNENQQQEYYLTDLPQILFEKGLKVGTLLHDDPRELDGFNSLHQYAHLCKRLKARILEQHMENGVTIVDPESTFIDHDVQIGPGTKIQPFTVIQGRVTIGNDCSLGPFTFLRNGTHLKNEVGIGAFVAVKNSQIDRGVLSRHLSYIGDAQVGKEVNIGAGTITANYDGHNKYTTVIKDKAFIGSGTIIVAPAEISEGTTTGAGAVITPNTVTEPGSLYLGVPAQKYKKGKEGAQP